MTNKISIFVIQIAGLRHGGFKTYYRLKRRIGVCEQLHTVSTNTLFEASSFMKRYVDYVGQRFGRLLIKEMFRVINNKPRRCIAICDCGIEREFRAQDIVKGSIKSCGCLLRESTIKRSTTHGLAHSRIDQTYKNMINRCYNPKNSHYRIYGGKGVKICDEWLNDKSKFFEWAFSNGYTDSLTIDRRDSNGNYEPSNCRWVTAKVNGNNTSRNWYIEYKGETKTFSEWCDILNLDYRRTFYRIKRDKWSVEKAFTIPNMTTLKLLTDGI